MFDVRLVAHEPNGGRSGVLPYPLELSAALPLNDVPSLTLVYPADVAGSGLVDRALETGLEVALEHTNSAGQWVEPTCGRFVLLERSTDTSDAAPTRTLTLPSYAWMLRKMRLLSMANLNDEGKRPFLSANAGVILRTLIDEAQARGTVTGLGVDFSTGLDSNGAAWSKIITLYLEPGIDVWTVLENLSLQGLVDWTITGRTLRVFNADTTLARDLSVGANPVTLRMGRDVVEAPQRESLTDVVSSALIRGEGNLAVTEANPSAPTPWGGWEAFISQGGVSDEGTALSLVQGELERGSRVRGEYTRGLTFATASRLPLLDYRPGDYVMAPGADGRVERVRVRQITLTRDADGVTSGNVVLNDRFVEADLRRSRRVNGIVGGASGDGGSGARPSPEGPDKRTPAAPEGLVLDSAAYIDTDGNARGRIEASWGAVTTATDSTALDVASYEVWARENIVGAPWGQVTSTTVPEAQWSRLPVGSSWLVRVRARGRFATAPGAWSSSVQVTVAEDTTPPPVPSAPVLFTRLGVIGVRWDGLSSTGTEMPRDFDRVEVAMGAAPGPTTLIDELRGPGAVMVSEQPYGEMRWFRFRSVDTSGNTSEWSVADSIATEALVDTDLTETTLNQRIEDARDRVDELQNNVIPGISSQAELALDAARRGMRTYNDLFEPWEAPEGSLWFDPSDGNKPYRRVAPLGNAFRTNVLPNPSFETNTTGYVSGSATTIARTTLTAARAAGNAALSVTVSGASASTGWVRADVQNEWIYGGGWVGISLAARRVAGVEAAGIAIDWLVNGQYVQYALLDQWELTTDTNSSQGRRRAVAQAPAGATGLRVWLRFYGSATTLTAPSNGSVHTDAWVVDIGDSRDAATRMAESPYMDGSVMPPFTSWGGTAHASMSFYYPMWEPVQDAAIEIADKRVTGNTRAPDPSDAVGRPEGAIWYHYSGNALVGAWRLVSGAWVSAPLDRTFIPAIDIGTGTFGDLSGARLKARSVVAGSLAVGDSSNLVFDPSFSDPASREQRSNANVTFAYVAGGSTVGGRSGPFYYLNINCHTAGASNYTYLHNWGGGDQPQWIPVVEGRQYRFSVMAMKSPNTTTGNLRLLLRTIDAAGQQNTTYPLTVPMSTITDQFVVYSTVWTAPDAFTGVCPGVQYQNGAAGANLRVTTPVFTPLASSVLIEDGAVTSDKIFANAVTAGKIDALAVTAGTIAANAVTTDKLDAGAVTAVKIDTNAITTDKLSANAITSKHTITGATIQTVVTANRGVKLTSTGLRAYDNNGNLTASILGASGEFNGYTLTGGTIRTAPSGQRVQIGTSTDNLPAIWFFDDNEYSRLSLSTHTGGEAMIWMRDSLNRARFSLNSSGSAEWTSPANRRAFRIQSSDAGGNAEASLIGPTQGTGSAFSWLTFGVTQIDGLTSPTATLGTTGSGSDASYLYTHASGSWMIGSPTRGRILMDNSSGELSLTTRSNLLSFYNLPTTTSTGNPITMIVSGTGRPSIYRNTSVRASKVDITDVGVDPAKVLDLPVRDWYDRTQWQRKQDACIQAENFGGLETLPFEDQVRATCELPRIPGLVAEEVEEAGLSEFCTYDENGDLAGVMYDRVPLLLIPLVRDLREQLAEMADRLNRLEGDHSE